VKSLIDPPIIREYISAKEEMAGITLQIVQLLKAGVPPGNIAVIYKENKYGEALTHYCRLMQIPVYSKRHINILIDPFIQKVLLLLKYLQAEHDTPYGGDEMLFEILHFDLYKNAPIEIAKLTVEANSKKYNEEACSIRKLLYDKANAPAKNLFDTGLPDTLKNCSVMLEALIAAVSNNTLPNLVSTVIEKAGILSYIMEQENKIQLLQLLTALFDFIKEECSRNTSMNLNGIIGIIDLMEKENISLPMVQVAGNDKGVNLLTAHGSKGLEFEYVFFAGVNDQFMGKEKKARKWI
jgi:DNA helicase-2/ATP-dependent DNA helicase PcrA